MLFANRSVIVLAGVCLCSYFAAVLGDTVAKDSRGKTHFAHFLAKSNFAVGDTRVRTRRSTVFQSDNCIRQNADSGICYGEVTCRHLRGKVAGFCEGLQGACCVFYRTCGGRTAQKVSHFQNQDWPNDEGLRETCTFSVTKHDQNICGLSVTLDKLSLPGRVGQCSDTFFWITGLPGRNLELICGHFTGVTYQFNITSTNEIYLRLKSYSGFKNSWRMTVRQITCADFKYELLPYKGDGATASLAPIAATMKPTTTTTTTTTKPIDYSRCGIKGPLSSRNVTSSKASKLSFLADSIWSSKNHIGTRDERSEESTETAIDTGLEWKGPELTDSVFYQYLGEESSILNQRITYGEETAMAEFPWQGAIFIGKGFHCGCSVISEYHVLTAAHCVVTHQKFPKQIQVILGVWNVRNSHDEKAETFTAEKVYSHPQYSRFTLQNDIAVLKLSSKIVYRHNIRPICLPQKEITLDGRLAYVTGWGKDQRKQLVTKLHKLQAAILSNDVCDQRWIKSGAQEGFIAPSMMCMDAQNGDSCNGDSGGPTVIEDPGREGQYVQAGVVSFGSGSCVDKRLPGVYTKVSSYIDWIQEKINLIL